MGKRAGFTLIELMIVVAILGILAAVAMPKFANMLRSADEGSTKGNLGSIRSAMSIYYGDMQGQYPTRLDSLTLEGKYLTALPYAKAAPYHAAWNVGSQGATQPTPEYGAWWYNNVPTDINLGSVWVNCSHTDSRGTIWTEY